VTEANARITVRFRTKRQTLAVADALRPEASHPAGKKGHATIVARGNQLSVRLEAKDSAALRAIMTSYLRMLAAIVNVLTELERLQLS
jgi:tRNA threonylcarbamoyladenosine modification (KEOPS) complex  Pcc1 subunit